MKFGSYDFTQVYRNEVESLPESSGLVLIRDKADHRFDVVIANSLRRRMRHAVNGEVSSLIKARYPISPESHVEFFYCSLGYVANLTVHKYRLRMLLKGKLVTQNTRGTDGKGYKINLFTYPETSEYFISIQTMASREDPLMRLYRMLNGKIKQTHVTGNPIVMNFSRKRGPFNETNSFIYDLYKEDIPTLNEAKIAARELALTLGTQYLLTANVVDRAQWKHPGWDKVLKHA